MRVEAWVTAAVEEKDVAKALMLAGSLRRVWTAKMLVVLTTFAVKPKLRKRLEEAFDLVIPFEQDASTGVSPLDYAKCKAFSLGAFKKCVFLSPNSLVLSNCDEIFGKYGSFAVGGNVDGLDSSIFLFSPSGKVSESLASIIQSGEEAELEGGTKDGQMVKEKEIRFRKCFNLWIRNNIPSWEIIEEKYNFSLNLEKGPSADLNSAVVIANFGDVHPLDLAPEGDFGLMEELGLIEKSVVQLCGIIFEEDIKAETRVSRPVHLNAPATEPIAIVGMSFRFPGGNNVDEFWDLLNSGGDAIKVVPEHRWRREQTYLPCQNRKVEAGFLPAPVDEFDAKFFRISGKEAEFMDPQQRLLHEVAWEALEDAMIDPLSLKETQTGIFTGSWRHDYREMLTTSVDTDFFRTYMGNSIGAGPARLSHFFETTGPSIGTESGCSSAIMAVDMACKSLRNRDSNLAMAGAVNLLLHPFDTNQFTFAIAPDARCKTFDERANGFGRAEGCAVLIMKRLSDAVRDEDNIWGLIRGSAVTQEGVSKSLGTPTVHCESLAMELALQDADVDPVDVSYIEAHGTGTPVGDPLEIAAITKAYSKGRSEPLVIGSVKTNVGHTESVCGITGIIKVLLSMKNDTIPKHLHLVKLNPAINLEAIPAIIPMETMPWVKRPGLPRIAGVNSFGITGGDGHAIIQEPPVISLPKFHASDVRPLHVMKLSATCKESFETLLSTFNLLLSEKGNGELFEDMAYSANTGRSTFSHRAVIIAKNSTEAAKMLRSKSFKQAEVPSSGQQLCFLFPGHGSQYPSMAASLYQTSPIFRNHFDKCDRLLTQQYNIDIRKAIWGKQDISGPMYSQISIFCVEYCLFKLWESWGVKPDYVIGHSLGEFAAAVAAGILDFEDALMLVAERSKLIDSIPEGKMLVIKADKGTVSQLMRKLKLISPNFDIDFAAFNAEDQTVVSGDSEMIEEFAAFCKKELLKTFMLTSTHAFHSRHMDPLLEADRIIAQRVKHRKGGKDSPKFISGMEGKLIDLENIDADYWVRHIREPVRFYDACKVAQAEGCYLFLEVGPHPVLSALTMMNIQGHSVTCLPSIRRKEDEWVTMLDSLAKLYLSDWKGEIDWKGFDRHYKRSRVSLPFYPFNRKPIWKDIEPALPSIHPLLGQALPTECEHSLFEKRLVLKCNSFLRDHAIGNTVVFPGAGFLEMCLAGGHAALQDLSLGDELKNPSRPITLKSFKIVAPLALAESGICRLQTVTRLVTEDEDEMGYSVGVHRYVPSSCGGVGEWICHAMAKFIPVPSIATSKTATEEILIDIPTIQQSWKKVDNKDFYERLPEVGFNFGPKFRSLEGGWRGENGMLVTVKVPEDSPRYLIHPVVGDAMIQAAVMWKNKNKEDNGGKAKLLVPVQIEEFTWLQTSDSAGRYIYCSTNEDGKVELVLLDDQGTHLAYMKDVDLIETTVKLVEGMIHQQSTAMPKIWKEVWKSTPGPLQSSYDYSKTWDFPILQFNDQQKQVLASINDIGEAERGYYDNLCDLTRLYFINAMYELGWKPRQGTQFTLEELVSLLSNPKEHHRRYFQFFLKSLSGSGIIMEMDDAQYYFKGPPPTHTEISQGLFKVTTPADSGRTEHRCITRTGRSLAKLLRGDIDPLQFLFTEDPSAPNMDQVYQTLTEQMSPGMVVINDNLVEHLTCDGFTDSYARTNNMVSVFKVLEIGSGTGIFTEVYLQSFGATGKAFEFYFTDISSSFFIAAETKFEKYLKQIVFKRFDMEEDPLAQGFSPKYFDMILVCETLHVAKDIRKTLDNIRCLLKPGGVLQIFETTMPDPRITMFFGLLEGYWQYEDLDLRPYHPTLTPEKWEQTLREIGCSNITAVPAYNNVHSCIVGRLASNITPPVSNKIPKHSWLIFSHESCACLANLLKDKLVGVNRKVCIAPRPDICTEEGMKEMMKCQFQLASEDMECLEGVIYLWGISDGSGNRDQSQISLPLISLLKEMTNYFTPRLYVVTQGTANVTGFEVTSPTAGTVHGIIKSLTNEIVGLHLNCLDLSPTEPIDSQVDEIFYNLWSTVKGNRCFAFREGKRLCAKMVRTRVDNNEPLPLPSGCERFQLVLPKSRMISDLEYDVLENYTLEGTEVEVEVKAIALNFRDVFVVLKPIPIFDDQNTLGMEFAGVVSKVGPEAKIYKVGDRVMGMGTYTNLSMPSHIKMEEELLGHVAKSMTYVESATLQTGFATTFYCLDNMARMRAGETVLMHCATGGIGLTAIQVAKYFGVDVIATAGSQRKRNYLRSIGIKHVFHSRNTDFGQQILEVTNGRGVDIVLNSLTGEGFKEASLSALATNGRFIEMSKLNVWTKDEVRKLRPDVFYEIADVRDMDKAEIKRLAKKLCEYIDSDLIRPLPYERFDAVNIRGALNHLNRAKHIGKIVCVMPEIKIENSKITVTTPMFNDMSTYLVTGGLGGIGFEVVKWMLTSGAKHVAIVSRSKPKPEIANQLELWNKGGKHVEAFAVDIGDYSQCLSLLQELLVPSRGFPQLRGVMHAAGVLADGLLEDQTWGKFYQAYNPKVDGSWNLHDLTKDLLLEHFVFFSSIAATMGSPGQSNHAAGNNFEDALAAYRRSNVLPATTVNWGNWGEVGVATEIDFPGIHPINTSQGILALETFLKTQSSHLSVVNVESFATTLQLFPSLKYYVDDKRLLGEMKATVTINSEELWKKYDGADDRETKLLLMKGFIKSTLKNILKMDQQEEIEDHVEFQFLGVDSLMMLEMKNGLQNIFGSRLILNASHLKDCNNTEALANRLVDMLEDEWVKDQNLPSMEELRQLVREDSALSEHIQLKDGMSVGDVSEIENVFLTGPLGTLGPYLLKLLSQQANVKKIYCLIRKMDRFPATERLINRLRVVGPEAQVDMTKVECIEGDITEERFGLSYDEYNRLAMGVDAILNCAVRFDHTSKYFMAPEGKKLNLRAVNVVGTNNVLEFAVSKRLKYVFHASTFLAITSVDDGDDDWEQDEEDKVCFSEDWQNIDAFDQFDFNGGYALSKHIGEQLCKQAIERGIPCKTFRFPLIGGDGQTGRCDYLSNHFVLRWLTYLKLKCMPDFPSPMICMSVDNCAKMSLDIFFNNSAPFDVYNINPTKIGLECDLIATIGQEFGIAVEPVPFSEFVEKLRLEKGDSPLASFKAWYEEEAKMIVQDLEMNNPAMKAVQLHLESNAGYFKGIKLPKLIQNYEAVESTEEVMRRDLRFLKESGVFDKFGIECNNDLNGQ